MKEAIGAIAPLLDMCLLLIVYVQDKCLTKRWPSLTLLGRLCCTLFVQPLALP